MRSFAPLLVAAASIVDQCMAGYVLEDDYMTDFYGGFDFFAKPDPTNGFVQYVDEATARSTNLIHTNTSGSAVQWGVDFTNKTPEGRPSIRIESKKTYDTGLVVIDVAHMPSGCGTWPAFWMVGPEWPTGGEIDILEGVNDMTQNGMTLHTGPGCKIGPDTSQFAGDVTTPDCDVKAPNQDKNVGCSIKHPSKASYGAGLNAGGGGVYATQWTDDAISVYFFPRDSIPADVLGESPDPSTWGIPAAKFTGGCDISKMFKAQQIVFDTTFCGDWAGVQWDDSSCKAKAPTCNEYVRDNPEAFKEAHWTINALKVYKQSGEEAPASSGVPAYSTGIDQSGAVPLPTATSNSTVPAGIPTAKPSTAPVLSFSSGLYPNPTSQGPITLTTTKTVATTVQGIPTSESLSTPSTAVASPTAPSSSLGLVPTQIAAGPTAPAPSGGPMPGFTWPGASGVPSQNATRRAPRSNAFVPLPVQPDADEADAGVWRRRAERYLRARRTRVVRGHGGA